MVILELGSLANQAAQRGEDRAAVVMREAASFILNDKKAVDEADRLERAEEERRREQAERKRRSRSRMRTGDVPGSHVTSRDLPSGFSPTPPFPKPSTHTTTPRARAILADSVAAEPQPTAYATDVDPLMWAIIERVGPDSWPEVAAFLRRRPRSTWEGWLKAFTIALDRDHATPADLAAVCRDDMALTQPIGTPKGLRVFIANAVKDRTKPADQAPSKPTNGRRASIAKAPDEYPEATKRGGVKWQD